MKGIKGIKNFIYRKYLRNRISIPQIGMFDESGKLFNNADSLIKTLAQYTSDLHKYKLVNYEFYLLSRKLDKRIKKCSNDNKWEKPISTDSSKLLYYIVRKTKPKTVVETGISKGVSTFFILNALRKNKAGKLYSFDILPNAGCLLSSNERKNWHFVVLDKRNTRMEFHKAIEGIGNIDIFLHDSDHSYKNQFFEYSTVFPKIVDGGFLLSDNVDFSYAFLDFARINKLKQYYLITNTAFGLAKISHNLNLQKSGFTRA